MAAINEQAVAQLERILLEVMTDCAAMEAMSHRHLDTKDTLHWMAVKMVGKYALVPPGSVADPKIRLAIIAIASGERAYG